MFDSSMTKDQLLAELKKAQGEVLQLRESLSKQMTAGGREADVDGDIGPDSSPDAFKAESRRLHAETVRDKASQGPFPVEKDIKEKLYSSTHFGVAVYDADFNFLSVNKTYADWAGKETGYFTGKKPI